MSILPTGNSSADRPACDYQAHLNRLRLPQVLRNPRCDESLSQSGFFKDFWGPNGICPVQLMGLLKTGEFVYFRARGNKVELEISATVDGAPHARYSKRLDVRNSELGTGALPASICVEFITRWLRDYRQRCSAEFSTYTGAPFLVSEADEEMEL